ncbi:MAG: RNA-binding protein [Oscillospiraceae bacterium]|nr:RNA-binding protein [Oscillospiraceae bacterium]
MSRLNSYYDKLSQEDRLLVSHFLDMIEICGKSYTPKFSAFLDERQIILAESFMNEQGCKEYKLYGGYEGASRKMLGVFPEYWEYKEDQWEDFPVSALRFKFREADKLSHRDFLGSFMSKQIKRNMLGDIIVGNGAAAVIVHDTVKPVLMSEISKIGSVGVSVSEGDISDLHPEQSFTEKNGTVSSLRLDGVVSLAAGVSREKSASLIKGGYVTVMYETIQSVSHQLSRGDIFSIRGYGKFILSSVNGRTKKDRIHITIKKYN